MGENGQYTVKDTALSVFSTQRPAFLSLQRDMERKKGKTMHPAF